MTIPRKAFESVIRIMANSLGSHVPAPIMSRRAGDGVDARWGLADITIPMNDNGIIELSDNLYAWTIDQLNEFYRHNIPHPVEGVVYLSDEQVTAIKALQKMSGISHINNVHLQPDGQYRRKFRLTEVGE